MKIYSKKEIEQLVRTLESESELWNNQSLDLYLPTLMKEYNRRSNLVGNAALAIKQLLDVNEELAEKLKRHE